ncbi:DUF5320 domain-containing protein [bacterium]|nr:DUF5320 domain-containing protein [bacterium]
MARGNGTGPDGMGPRTGRGLGYCNGYDTPGFANPMNQFGGGRGYGRGNGFGRGYGRGNGRGYGWGYAPNAVPFAPQANYPAPDKETEKAYLENSLKDLKTQMDNIEKRLKDLSKEK